MGPGYEGRSVPLSKAGGWRDDVTAMNELVRSHPTLTWIPGDPQVATWQDDDGAQREERDRLGDLVDYLRAKLWQRP